MNKELKEYLYMLVGKELTRDNYEKVLDYFNQLKQERDHYKNKTLNNLYMKNINGEKVFCLENDKETFRDMIFELQERIDKVIEYINEELKYTNENQVSYRQLNDIKDLLEDKKVDIY